MIVQVEIAARVVGTQSEPKVLTTLTMPATQTPGRDKGPFGPIPISKLDLAAALRYAADELEGMQR